MPAFVPQDFYFKEARRLGYVARSAFKLLEIQQKHKVIPSGGTVLDLGCAPGAWLQVACQALGPSSAGGSVVGVDIKAVRVPSAHCDARCQVLQADAMAVDPAILRERSLQGKGFTTILSDMCPSTSGDSVSDVAHSISLAERALYLALGSADLQSDRHPVDMASSRTDEGEDGLDGWRNGLLRPRGAFVAKVLEGPGIQEFAAVSKAAFAKVVWVRPRPTRPASREIYIVGKGRRQ